MAWIRSTPGRSWPVVGSSRITIGVPIARIEARASSLRSEKPRSYGFVFGVIGQADRGQGIRDGGLQGRAAQPEVARSEADLGPDPAGEDLAVGILEGQPDPGCQGGDSQAGGRLAIEQDPALGRPEKPVQVSDEG